MPECVLGFSNINQVEFLQPKLQISQLKGSVSRDFRPIWAPDKQADVFSNSVSISPRYSNFLKLPPQSQTPRCASYPRVRFRSVHHTTESKCTPPSQNQNLYKSLGAFNKGTIRRNPFKGEQFYHVRKDLKKKKCYLLRLKF